MTEVKTRIQPNLGLEADVQNRAVELLQTLLADEFMLYTKLRKYHWNVTGPQFRALHEMFEEQYEALAEKIDVVAERIRAYGALANGTMNEFLETTRLEEQPGLNPKASMMIEHIVADHEALIRFLREDVEIADDLDDVGLEDFLTGTLQEHQEMAWMLRAYLEGENV